LNVILYKIQVIIGFYVEMASNWWSYSQECSSISPKPNIGAKT
jgi:hypothetical protein